MNTTDTRNQPYLSALLRDAVRDVLDFKTCTIEEAAKKYELPQEWIEAKINDPTFEPPQPERKKASRVEQLRTKPSVPRDVLTDAEKKLKTGFIDPLQKRRLFHQHVQCLREAAREVSAEWLTERAACEKYDVKPEDLQARLKDPNYQPVRPLNPNEREAVKHKQKQRGGILAQEA